MNRKKHRMNEKKYRKYIIGLWLVIVLALVAGIVAIGKKIWNSYRDDVIQQQEEQMLIISDSLADNMQETISGYATDLDYLCRLIKRGDDETVLSAYLYNDDKYVVNMIYSDENGKLIWEKQPFKPSDYYDSFKLEDDVSMNVVGASDKKIYFVLEKTLENGKKVEMIIDMKAYYKAMISGIKIGTNGYVVLKNKDGVIFMHPSDVQLGETMIEGRENLYGELKFEELEKLLEKQNKEKTGINEYYSYWWTNKDLPRVKKISASVHVNCGDGYMIVSVVRDYDDIYRPLTKSFTVIAVTFSVILLILLIFVTLAGVQLVKGRRNEQEIEYLRDLNEVLEETKRSEEVIAHQQRLQIMGTMTGGIAHEFNNLLTPIMGYSELLLDVLPPESEEADYANEIFEASDKAKDVIKQIAGLSRKNMETVFSFVPIKKALRRSVKMVKSVCPSNITLIDGNSFEAEGFLGNETQLNQVILNISVNAFHAIGKEKEGIVSVHGEVVDAASIKAGHGIEVSDVFTEFLCISIEDNGCGMEPEVLAKIFDPFFTTKVGGQGTGLGLSVVEQIVHSHKGYIFAESTKGVGTRFTIYLPKAIRQENSRENQVQSNSTNISILVVDDNVKVLKLLEKKFKKLGINIETVSNTQEANVKLGSMVFDAIVIDQELSKSSNGDNGILYAMSIGSEYPDIIRIVMAEQIRKEIIEAKQHGYIEGYVEKPVSDSKIIEEIRRHRQ